MSNVDNHIDFCKKYPQTIEGYEEGINLLQYQIDNNITPVIDYFMVSRLIKMHNDNPNNFSEYKDLEDDWHILIKNRSL